MRRILIEFHVSTYNKITNTNVKFVDTLLHIYWTLVLNIDPDSIYKKCIRIKFYYFAHMSLLTIFTTATIPHHHLHDFLNRENKIQMWPVLGTYLKWESTKISMYFSNTLEVLIVINCSCMSQWARFGTSKIFIVPIV